METNGKTAWMETPAGQKLEETLTNQRILAGLDNLLNRIDTLENAVDRLSVAIEQGPGMVSMVADIADDTYKNAAENGVDIEQRLANALKVAERLTAPQMMEKIDKLFTFFDQAPGLISMTMDTIDEGVKKSEAKGIYLEKRIGNALTMAEKLTAPDMVDKLNQLLQLADQAPGLISIAVDSFDDQIQKLNDSNLDVQSLIEISQLASVALSKAKKMPAAKVGGIFSMLRTMRDKDRQKAIGFLMNVAKAFGQEINKKTT